MIPVLFFEISLKFSKTRSSDSASKAEEGSSKQKDNYSLAEKVYEVTLDQYREGVASMTALLQDELSMSNALNNYLNAYHSYKLSELKLLKLSKQLPLLTE